MRVVLTVSSNAVLLAPGHHITAPVGRRRPIATGVWTGRSATVPGVRLGTERRGCSNQKSNKREGVFIGSDAIELRGGERATPISCDTGKMPARMLCATVDFPSSPSPARITIRDLAKRLGLSHAAVSMALRDHPNIAAKTRQRVKAEADLCGYRPEPMLSALAAYRQMKKPSVYHGTLAWLFDHPSRQQLFATPLFNLYFEGACWRAASLGFQIEEFCLGEPGMTPARMSNILLSRGIQGVLVAPLSQPNSRLKMHWERFSSVTFGFSLLEPQLHLVSSTQYRIGMAVTHKLQELGYERVGFFGSKNFDERTDQNFTAGFHIASMNVPIDRRVPPLLIPQASTEQETFAAVRAWVSCWGLDAAVCTAGMQNSLIAAGYRIPEDLAVALIGYQGFNRSSRGWTNKDSARALLPLTAWSA